MTRRILLLDGHPDPDDGHLVHALAGAYARGAAAGGHRLRQHRLAALTFPLLRSQAEFRTGAPPPDIAALQQDLLWAEHLVLVYPLWLGTTPALLQGCLEQTLRPDFAFDLDKGPFGGKLKGRSARLVLTMGMPALAYRWFYRSHGLKSLKRNVLHLTGVQPVRTTLFGGAETAPEARRQSWLDRLEALGRRGT